LDVESQRSWFNDWFTFTKPCAELVALARDEEKLLLNVTADSVIRLLPALNISPEEVDEIVLERVSRLIRRFLNSIDFYYP
jgi:acetylornithine/succinyldiaminopimelate/putrescine aminotransferase